MTSGTPRWWRHRLVLLFCPKLQCTPPLPRPPPLIQSFPRVSFTAFSAFFTASSKVFFLLIQTFPGVPFSVISLSLSCTTSVEKFQVFFCNCNLSLVAFISPAIVMSTAFTEVHGRGLDKVDNILWSSTRSGQKPDSQILEAGLSCRLNAKWLQSWRSL